MQMNTTLTKCDTYVSGILEKKKKKDDDFIDSVMNDADSEINPEDLVPRSRN